MPSGTWLKSHSVSRLLTRRYVDNGWLERANRGVFRLPVPNVTTSGAIDWKT
ncbi:AbiEi antitoxin N-terminal domain-containing protein [Vreelandella zhanjiangensis]|uniref:AbiEi antitoxin N-terminal domain-containing protein n=1 Tax=Vreelandella zhanjiangensis TaxID=1121960 RepID=UPI00402A6232